MLSRLRYVLRETFASLRRNVTLTAAALLTVVVSLLLVGLALITRQGVSNSLTRWSSGVEFIVFMNPEATQDQIDAVDRDLSANPQIERHEFLTKQQAYDEFLRLNPDNEELTQAITVEGMPPNFKVVPQSADETVVESLSQQFATKPGVSQVTSTPEQIRTLRILTTFLTVGLFVVAIVLLCAAVMLIWNTIRTAMFARRREIEIMKLVGATNWFIRVPFMLEGMIQGVVGAGVAIGAIYALNGLFRNRLASAE